MVPPPQWKSFQPYRDDIKINGESGKHRRFYTWDHTHNDIEVWDRNGLHLGSMDPATGEKIKAAEPGRKRISESATRCSAFQRFGRPEH